MSQTLLTVDGLSLILERERHLLTDVDLRVRHGEAVGLVGPSGSGKSLLARTLVGLQPAGLGVRANRLSLRSAAGQDLNLLNTDAKTWKKVRGRKIALISQEPRSALNPVQTCGTQLRRTYHSLVPTAQRTDDAIAIALDRVNLGGARTQVQAAYPHQLSGGQLQRVVIAQALLGEPELLIADEITSALDAITTRDILILLRTIREETGLSVLFITHRKELLGFLTDRSLQIREGRVVPFAGYRPDRSTSAGDTMLPKTDELVRLEGLDLAYAGGDQAVIRNLNYALFRGQRMALVGPSGCGKSTLAAFLVGLLPATVGTVRLAGHSADLTERHLRTAAQINVQLVFQDVAGSLNPNHTVGRALREFSSGRDRGAELLERVGLPPDAFLTRYPSELSGGEKQRVAIARALAAEPTVLICDEAFAGLDAPLQQRLQDLLCTLSDTGGLTVLIITHDLGQVRSFASHVDVMDAGRIVESGTPARLFAEPKTQLARALVRAADYRSSGEE